MLLDYIQAAMRKAQYEILADNGSFYGHIPDCQGVWANGRTLEECRTEVQEVLEDWILIGMWHHHRLPVIDGGRRGSAMRNGNGSDPRSFPV